MSRLRRFEIVEHQFPPSCLLNEISIFDSFKLNPWFPTVEPDLDLLSFAPTPPLFLDDFDAVADLIQIHRSSARRRELHLQTLSDRVSALELGLERLSKEKQRERKYTWTAEIKSPDDDRKYKWTAEKKGLARSYKMTAEIKRRGAVEQTYTFKVSDGEEKVEKKKKCEKVKEKSKSVGASAARIVQIEEPSDLGGIVLRQAFAKRVDKRRGKRKELSPQDAAILIQKTFRAYLIQRSQALRALRELAIAKTKLKEIRALFNNFSYRRRLSRDAEERQRFSEKIIVLLLTVDAIEGADTMVRASKKSMVDELEAMLDVVDPQPVGRSSSMKRRTFDMPDGVINKELAAGVAQVVRMLDQEATSSEAFEACL
ncbi:hypothetical protein C2S51_032412 [Perilla frutescens var. frutescens]|nr:hypothetical protein C2S51_032412 [Perilla frutescens var. frutescens]